MSESTSTPRKCWNCESEKEPCYDGGTPWCTDCGVVDNPSNKPQIERPKRAKQPEPTPMGKANFATEVAFKSLIEQASALGISLHPVMGLMYLPDEAITRQFQEACRAVLEALGFTSAQ
jgi:hypothetical protein